MRPRFLWPERTQTMLSSTLDDSGRSPLALIVLRRSVEFQVPPILANATQSLLQPPPKPPPTPQRQTSGQFALPVTETFGRVMSTLVRKTFTGLPCQSGPVPGLYSPRALVTRARPFRVIGYIHRTVACPTILPPPAAVLRLLQVSGHDRPRV